MKIGALSTRCHIEPQLFVDLVVRLEEVGFDSFWLTDHIAGPVDIASKYPYGTTTHGPDAEHLDALIGCAFVAAVTSRMKVGTCVVPLFNRDPISLAKQASIVDVLSGGRLQLGLGAGWCAEEAAILGNPSDHKWGRLSEAIEIMRLAWSEPIFEYHGRYYDLPKMGMRPFPVQTDLPIWIGGDGPLGVKTTIARAQGNILGGDPDPTPDQVRALRDRLPPHIQLAVAAKMRTRPDKIEYAHAVCDAGADLLLFMINNDLRVARDQVDWAAENILPAFAAA